MEQVNAQPGPPEQYAPGRRLGLAVPLQHVGEIGNRKQAGEPRHEAGVQGHVAVEHVTELVRDDGLQLVAVELFECARRDADHGTLEGRAGCEGIDRRLPLEHPDVGLGHLGRERHLGDDVEQLPVTRIGVIARHRQSAKMAGECGAAVAQLPRLHRAASEREHEYAAGDTPARIAMHERRGQRALPTFRKHRAQGQAGQQQHDAGGVQDAGQPQGNRERDAQPKRMLPGKALSFEEIRRHAESTHFPARTRAVQPQ